MPCVLMLQVLIFSRSVKMLNIIQKIIVRRGDNFVRLDGSTAKVGACPVLYHIMWHAHTYIYTYRRIA